MITETILPTVLPLFAAIITFWIASVSWRRAGRLWPFLPLMLFAATLCGTSALSYYDLYLTVWQAFIAVEFLIAQIWFFGVLVALINKQP